MTARARLQAALDTLNDPDAFLTWAECDVQPEDVAAILADLDYLRDGAESFWARSYLVRQARKERDLARDELVELKVIRARENTGALRLANKLRALGLVIGTPTSPLYLLASDAVDELTRQRNKAEARVTELEAARELRREDYNTTKATLAAIVSAWTVPGPAPYLHERAKHSLRRTWPALSNAIDRATLRKVRT